MADGSVTIDARLALDELKKDLKNLKSVISSSLPSASKAFKSAGKFATSAGKACSVATTAVSAFGGYSLKAGANFQTGMSKVQAISGVTKSEIEALTNKAKEMGAKTKFSATESAEAFQYMAMAGWKTEDMLNGIEGIMNLAAASGEDLASVSDIVTDALTAFGLKASDSAHFADVLAKASSNSNTNVGMMGETFKYVAPLAGSMGYSIEDTATAIGLMANAGIKSTQAGTALRSMLTRLVKPPAEAAEALKKLGITAKNNDGTMKPLSQTLQELRSKFAGLSDSEKASYASAIAGQEAMSGLLAIVNASDADYQKLSESINNADGSAKQMADTMNDNVSGAFTILKSNLEASGIKAFEKVKDSLTDLLKSATDLIPKLEPIFDGVFSQLNPILDKVSSALKNVSDSISNMSDDELKAIGETIFKVASAGPKLLILGKVFGVLSNASEGLSKGVKNIKKLHDAFKGLKDAGTVGNIASNSLKLLKGAFSALTSPVGLVVVAIGILIGIFVLLWNKCEWFRNFWIGLWENIKNGVSKAKDFITDKIQAIGEFFGKVSKKFEDVKKKVADVIDEVISTVKNIPTKLQEFWKSIVTGLQNAWSSITSFFTEKIPAFIQSVITWLSELPYKIGFLIGTILGHIIQFGIDVWNWITVELPVIIQGIIQWFSELPGKIWDFLVDIVNKIMEWGTNAYNTASEWVSNTVNSIIQWFSELPGKIWSFLTDIVSKIQAWGKSAWSFAKIYTSNLINSVIKFFSELPGKIWAKLTEVIDKVKSWGTSMVEKGKEAAKNLVTTVIDTISELPGKVMDVGKNIVEGLWNGITGAGDWLKNKVGEFAGGILDGMKQTLGIHSPSRVFRDEVGKYIALGVGEGFIDNIAAVYKKMKASVDFETQKISANIMATNDLKTAKGHNQNITNNNDNGICVNQNFYEKVQSPHETAKATKNAIRRVAYAK